MPHSTDRFLQLPLNIVKMELLIVDIPQRQSFKSAIGIRKSRKALIIKWTNHEGINGYGECSCRPDPYYSYEFLDGVVMVIRQFLFPLACQATTFGELGEKMKQVRGWPFAKAAIEMAAHHVLAQEHGFSIFDAWDRPSIERIPVGISIGLQKDTAEIEQSIEEAKTAGYQRLKFKIHPNFPKKQIDVLLRHKDDIYLSFDANGSMGNKDIDTLQSFLPFNTPIEQPFPPSRIDIYQAVKKELSDLKVCLDEEVKSLGQLIQAHQLDSLDELNIKPGRVGGLVNSIAIAEYCMNHNIPCWVGGMFESGIGRSVNLQFAARLTDARAHDLSPSSRYFEQDVVREALKMDNEGYISLESAKSMVVDEKALRSFTVEKIKLISEV
jgi:O-succinylbenzoate synthase